MNVGKRTKPYHGPLANGGMRNWFLMWIYRHMQVTMKWKMHFLAAAKDNYCYLRNGEFICKRPYRFSDNNKIWKKGYK